MNVLNIDIGAGSTTAAPRTEPSGHTAPPASHPRPSSPSPSGISLTRLAWFDANGDGRIDPRAAGSGGDATLLVPAHQVDLPTYDRAARPAADAPSTPSTPSTRPSGSTPPDTNPAQTQRAVAAYQRYGQAPAAAPTSVAAQPSASPDSISVAA